MSSSNAPTDRRPAAGPVVAIVLALVLTFMLGALASACGGDDDPPLVLAASSLTDVAPAITEAAGLDVQFVFAGSPTLVRQLGAGVDAVAIITADPTQMDAAAATGRTGPAADVTTNRLVLAVADGNPGGVTGPADLARDELLVGRCAAAVPCGVLTDEVAAAAGITIAADTEEPSVRSLVSKLDLGELDTGLVYATDARSLGLTVVDDLAGLASPATTYQAAVVDGAAVGTEVIAAFTGPEAQARLAAAGFGS